MRLSLVLVLAMAVSATGLMGSVQTPPQPPLSVGGRVVDSVTNRPVAGAAVTISGGAPLPYPPTLVADAEGRFRFDNLIPGRYTVVAAAVGYLAGGEHIESGMAPPSVTVRLDAGVSQTDLRIGLITPAIISGVVLDSDNTPVESAQMGALREVYVAGVRRFVVGSGTTSNDAGQYRFDSLVPGRYVVCVIGERLTVPRSLQALFEQAAAGSAEMRTSFQRMGQQGNVQLGTNRGFAVGDFWLKPGAVSVGPLVTSDGTVWSAPDTCNGGARNPLGAPLMAVTAGEHRLGETLLVDLGRAPSVSGIVIGPAGPIAWQGVALESEGFDALGWIDGLPYASTTTDAEGRFTILGVAPGNYVLKSHRVPVMVPDAAPGTLPQGETLSAQMPISVGRDDVGDVRVVMDAAAQLKGRLVFAGTAQPPSSTERARARVSFATANGTTARMPFIRPTTIVQPDGTFETAGLLPDRYIVSVAPMGAWQLDRAELNGVDVSDVPFVVDDRGKPELVVTLTDAQWQLDGTVRDEKSQAVATGTVVLFPTDRSRWISQGAQPRRQRQAEVRNGTYSIAGLPAGEYFVVAVPVGATSDWQSPERFARWATGATRVTLGEHESRTLDLKLGGLQ